jgi:gliding motility-associated-like protein
VDAGPDQEIFLGEAATVSGSTDLDPGLILSQQWDSLGIMLCDDCPVFDLNPLKTTTYRYRVESLSGCIMTDEVTIYVLEQGRYFIGNVFTPNGDNANDVIMVHTSPGVVKVNKWIIFDRWGNTVFGRTDFDPNDPSIFWDGHMASGEELNPGVFSYLLEVELLNGSSETYHGDITLLK